MRHDREALAILRSLHDEEPRPGADASVYVGIAAGESSCELHRGPARRSWGSARRRRALELGCSRRIASAEDAEEAT
jgi:hypothetical protein